MKRTNRLILVGVTLVLLAVCVQPLHAGDGTYNEGTPDTIDLHVLFDEYDESCFDSASCPDWETLFKQGSLLLFDATERQVSIGSRLSHSAFYS